MKRPDLVLLALLLSYATFIWLRDPRWLDSAADTLPILAALPVAVWLGAPWRWTDAPWRIAPVPAVLGTALFPLGMLLDSTLVLAASWTALAWSWVSRRFVDDRSSERAKLLALAFVSFPWLATDLSSAAWWFRLSGAAGAERVLGWAGFDVLRQGTFLVVNGFAVSVEPACSGMNGLQALLVAGTTLAYLRLRRTPRFWWNLALLPAAAWLANVLRIVAGSAAGASMSAEAAARWVEPLHLFAGWVALVAMFAVCWGLFALQERTLAAPSPAGRRGGARPWLEALLIAYAAWSGRGLLDTWFTAPFDRFAWIAFGVWVLPLAAWGRVSAAAPQARRRIELTTPWRAGLGLLLLLAGDAADLNVCRHLGIACVLAGFAPARRVSIVLWWLGAVCWLPSFGWAGSHLQLSPELVAGSRIAIALAATATAMYGARVSRSFRRRTSPGDAATPVLAGATAAAPTSR